MDMKKPIKSYILKKWQDRWSSPLLTTNKKYKSIRGNISYWPSSFQKDRRSEIILSRLRIGHTRLTHQFILEGGDAPVCARCDSPLSVEHILVHCPQYSNERQKFNLAGKCIGEILGDDVDVLALMSFLKSLRIFKEI